MPRFTQIQRSRGHSVEQEQYVVPEHQDIESIDVTKNVDELLAKIAGELALNEEVTIAE